MNIFEDYLLKINKTVKDNKDILLEIGYSKDEISTLEKNKII